MVHGEGFASEHVGCVSSAHNSEYLDFRIADADLRLAAPRVILNVVDRMLASVSRHCSQAQPALNTLVDDCSGIWKIDGRAAAARKNLTRDSKPAQVAGAAVAAMLSEIAHFRGFSVWRAAVLERRGRALALVGDDWESAIGLTVHLHTRGWRIISGDYAIVDLATMRAFPFRKLLHLSSSIGASLPNCYCRAIEASLWYASANAVSFYAVDPTLVNGQAAWGESTAIDSILKIDGRMSERPSLENCGDFAITDTLFARSLSAPIASAMLILGKFIHTADFVERWFAAPEAGVKP